jgi:very-short-patch-repair endonuclease
MSNSFNQRLHLNASGKLYQFARDLRKAQTLPEDILWQYLRGRKLDGLKFRRQHPLVEYVADFYCHEKKLVIELDGSVHDSKINIDYDQGRTSWLAELEVTVIRFRKEEVIYKMEFVIDEIRNTIRKLAL